MPYRKLTSRDQSFIKGQTDRLLNQMNSSAEYLATVQTYEAAKARANQAYLAMELENDPEKKLRWQIWLKPILPKPSLYWMIGKRRTGEQRKTQEM